MIINREKNFAKRKANNVYYYKTLSKIKNSNIKLIKISDFDYQNFRFSNFNKE